MFGHDDRNGMGSSDMLTDDATNPRFAQPPVLATIAIVPRETFSQTEAILERIYQKTEAPFKLVCIDGGSPPGLRRYLEKTALEKKFTLVRSDAILAPNQARNIALSHVDTKYVAFVDNDVFVEEGWLTNLLKCAEETRAWVVGPLYCEFKPLGSKIHMAGGACRIDRGANGGNTYLEILELQHRPREEGSDLSRRETGLIEFHCVLVDMAAFDVIGPLDEGLSCMFENGDFCLAIQKAGGKIYLEPRSVVTYVPPTRLDKADDEYFQLRWSEAWIASTIKHLSRKYGIPIEDESMEAARIWLRHHRRHRFAWLRRGFGNPLGAAFAKVAIYPIEELLNRRKHDRSSSACLSAPSLKVIRPS
jgi:GT2 family glycosyltransferase